VLVVLILIVFHFLLGSLQRALEVLAEDPLGVIIASAIIASEEALKSTRFLIAARSRGERLRPKDALKVHFAAFAVGIVTPAFSGALPTAAAMLGDILNISPSESLSVAAAVSFFDSMIPSMLTITVFPFLGFYSIPLVLIALAIILTWITVLSNEFERALVGLISRAGQGRVASYIKAEALRLRPALLNLLRDRDALALLTTVSLVSYFLEGVSLYVITGGRLLRYIYDVVALLVSYVGGNVPTPGGVGGVEYGLSLLISRGDVVRWRVAYLSVGAVSLSLVGVIARSYVSYAGKLSEQVRAPNNS
jgi:uncharacterized protein (TIRG00374 family)